MTTNKLLQSCIAFLCFMLSTTSNIQAQNESESAETEPPIVTHEEVPYIVITIENDTSRWLIQDVHLRERVLSEAFSKALKSSKLKYAYGFNFNEVPRQKWVPQLNMRITSWTFRPSGVAECIIDAHFYDASDVRHDLKGTIGFESTDGMTDDRYDQEAYLKKAAQTAFENILRSIRKKGLYRD